MTTLFLWTVYLSHSLYVALSANSTAQSSVHTKSALNKWIHAALLVVTVRNPHDSNFPQKEGWWNHPIWQVRRASIDSMSAGGRGTQIKFKLGTVHKFHAFNSADGVINYIIVHLWGSFCLRKGVSLFHYFIFFSNVWMSVNGGQWWTLVTVKPTVIVSWLIWMKSRQ